MLIEPVSHSEPDLPFMPTRLKELREVKELSQEKLAEISGVSQSVITKAEQGRSVPNGEMLERLASALDCTIDYLFSRSDEFSSVRGAAVSMSFAIFARARTVSPEQVDRCRRVLDHESAPKTSAAWKALAEMMEMSLGPSLPPTTNLTVISRSPRSRAKGS